MGSMGGSQPLSCKRSGFGHGVFLEAHKIVSGLLGDIRGLLKRLMREGRACVP